MESTNGNVRFQMYVYVYGESYINSMWDLIEIQNDSEIS